MGALRRVGRLLLRLYPPHLRRAYGDEILRSLDDDLRDAGSARGIARAGAAARAMLDVATAGLVARAERLYTVRTRRGPDRPGSNGRLEVRMFPGLVTDVRHAARGLRAAPAFTTVSVLTLALTIGTASAIFAVVNGVLLKPLPYTAPDRLVNIWNDLGRGAQSLPAVHPADFRDYQAWSETFEEFAAASGGDTVDVVGIITTAGAAAEQVDVSAVSANFLPLLGVTPLLGRHFTAADERQGAPGVVLLSHRLWGRRFGGDPGLVGRTIRMDGRDHRVVGVLPPEFQLHLPAEAYLVTDAEIWVPLRLDLTRLPPRNYTYLTVFGRLKDGVTLRQAQLDMDGIAERLRRAHPEHRASELRIRVVPLHHDIVKRVRPALLTLLAAVAVVVLIGCANVANLLLSRAGARRRELAVHAALGATRWRLVQRLLLESAWLAVVGTAIGLGFAKLALAALAGLRPANLPRIDNIVIDYRVLAAVSFTCALTAVLCGILPARRASRRSTVADLKDGAGGPDGGSQDRTRARLVLAEIALSFVLIVLAMLLVRSAVALHHVSPGFVAEGVLTFRLSLPEHAYPGPAERRALFDRLQQRLQALPGVHATGATSQLPLTGSGPLSPYAFDEATARNWERVTADGRDVSPGFFPAVGAQLLAGRLFTELDGTDGRQVVIIDDELARRAWPHESAIGQRLQVEPPGSDDTYAEVIGVVEHLRLHELGRAVRPQIWEPLLEDVGHSFAFAIRTRNDAALLTDGVRRAVAELDPGLAPRDIRPLAAFVSAASAQMRLNALLMLAFAALAMVLGAVGVYGSIMYSVLLRTREFGIRQALGLEPRRLRRMVLGQAAALGTVAIALGLLGCYLIGPLVEPLLYETDPGDPLVLAGVSAFLLLLVLTAAWAPARRATSVDPVVALRQQ